MIRVTHLCTQVVEKAFGRGSPRRGAALAHRRTAFTRFRPRFGSGLGTGMESTTRQTFLGARIGSAARGAEIGYGAAALPNYGEESSHVQREREKGKKGTACSLPPHEATAT